MRPVSLRLVLWSLASLAGRPASSILSATNVAARGSAGGDNGKAIKTATLVNYGPQRATVRGPGLYLHGPDLCAGRHPKEAVRGKVVFTDDACEKGVYEWLEKCGALGLVYLGAFAVPGPATFRHEHWDRRAMANGKVTAVCRRGCFNHYIVFLLFKFF